MVSLLLRELRLHIGSSADYDQTSYHFISRIYNAIHHLFSTGDFPTAVAQGSVVRKLRYLEGVQGTPVRYPSVQSARKVIELP